MNEDRLIDLETRYSHQELNLERLEIAVFEQHRRIEELEVRLRQLGERLDGILSADVGPVDQKPPHY